jgi:hypothetical protein
VKSYSDYLARKRYVYKGSFDSSTLAEQFITAYESGERVTVVFYTGDDKPYDVKRGTIGVTTGRQPVFLLMLTKRSTGSSYVLGPHDQIGTMEDYRLWKNRHDG